VNARKKVVNCFSKSKVSQMEMASGSAGEKPTSLAKCFLTSSVTALLRPRSRGRKMKFEMYLKP